MEVKIEIHAFFYKKIYVMWKENKKSDLQYTIGGVVLVFLQEVLEIVRSVYIVEKKKIDIFPS